MVGLLHDLRHKLIQPYFRDELSEVEQEEFDLSLADTEFQTEVDFQAQVFEGIVKRDIHTYEYPL